MKEDVNKDIECPNCQTVYKAIRADAPPPPKAETTIVRKSKLAEIGSGKKKEDDEDDRPSKRKRNRDDEDDDRPSKRKRNRDDDDDEEDERPSKRKRNRDEDDDDEDDRPLRRRSSRRRDDDDDDDYDRPRRRRGTSSRRRSGGNGERPVLVTIVAILEFLGAAGSVICGIGLMVAGPVILGGLTGMAESIPNNPDAANSAQVANAKAGMQGVAAGITGAFICCGVFSLLWGVLQVFGGMGLMKMQRYGQIITWILAVLAIMSALYGGYSSMGVRGGGLYAGGGSLFQLAFGVVAIIAMVKHNDEFE